MDNIEKWLKSLRLHKYTHLFKELTYEQMLNLDENYLIDRDVTKGARNKMLVSVKKLNLRQERLVNMIEDLDQNNISMKEALTVLKDMLVTPIPPPSKPGSTTVVSPSLSIHDTPQLAPKYRLGSAAVSLVSSTSSALSSSTPSLLSATPSTSPPLSLSPSISPTPGPGSSEPCSESESSGVSSLISPAVSNIMSSIMSATPATTITTEAAARAAASIVQATASFQYLDPYDLTHLFIETLEKVARRLIQSAGMEDSACHGIMTTIVDECLKHNSFTSEQKARVSSFKQHFTKEQKAKVASISGLSTNINSYYSAGGNVYGYGGSNHINTNSNGGFGHRHRAPLFLHGQPQHNPNHLNYNVNNHLHHHYPHHQQQTRQHYQNNFVSTGCSSSSTTSKSSPDSSSLAYQALFPHHSSSSSAGSSPSPSATTAPSSSSYHGYNQRLNYYNTSGSAISSNPLLRQKLSQAAAAAAAAASYNFREYSLLHPSQTFELPCLRAFKGGQI